MELTRVLAYAEGSDPAKPTTEEGAAAGELLEAVLKRLPSGELVRGAFEMASMRHFPGEVADIRAISDWVADRAEEAEEVAFHYIMFAGDAFPARHAGHVARSLALRVLRETGKDHFERFITLSETDDLEILSGVTLAFAEFREERALPFLVSRLKDEHKAPRAETVRALGRIGTPLYILGNRSHEALCVRMCGVGKERCRV